MALEMHRPIVMVNAVLMEEARTMSGLSPVARMERPIRVPRNRINSRQTTTVMTAATSSLYGNTSPKSACAIVKMVCVFSIGTLEEKPITARLTVYSPVLVMMPARIDGTPRRVCKVAVTKPEAAPAAIAKNRPSTGCPATAAVAETAHPRVKVPSVLISAIFKIRKLRNSAIATSA